MDDLTVFSDPRALAEGAAALIAALAGEAVSERGRFTVALAGGNTPRPVYERLAARPHEDRVAWDRVEVFFGDERCVPPDDARSNYRLAQEALLDRVPLPPDNVHRIRGEEDPAAAARDYEQELRRCFGPASIPVFDLICLGMGDNGHTASLFPATPVLHESRRWAAPVYVQELAAWRVTLTAPVLNAAREVVFLVTGANKADMLRRVRTGPYTPDELPAQLIEPASGRVRWLVDAAAAGREDDGRPSRRRDDGDGRMKWSRDGQ